MDPTLRCASEHETQQASQQSKEEKKKKEEKKLPRYYQTVDNILILCNTLLCTLASPFLYPVPCPVMGPLKALPRRRRRRHLDAGRLLRTFKYALNPSLVERLILSAPHQACRRNNYTAT